MAHFDSDSDLLTERTPTPLVFLHRLSPWAMVLGSFALVIAAGTSLLPLPASSERGISFLDALFTATSATCVTGLSVIDVKTELTLFGQVVLFSLFQIGGLGIMTLGVALFAALGRSVSHRDCLIVSSAFGDRKQQSILPLVLRVVSTVVGIELVGSILLFFALPQQGGSLFSHAWYALFHSVSAFCNAGFALFDHSLMEFQGSFSVNLIMMTLILLGGFGFIVLYDLWFFSYGKFPRSRLSLHSQLVVATSTLFLLIGFVTFFIFEYDRSLASLTFSEKILASLFQSVTTRTAGFNSIDFSQCREATLLVVIALMFIGASPGSCGGGIKTTTVAVLYSYIIGRVRGFSKPTLFLRTIPRDGLERAVSLAVSSILIVFFGLLLLLSGKFFRFDPIDEHTFLPFLFEAVSAFATVGLSTGLTEKLSAFQKVVIISLMYIGRVGVFTFVYLVVEKGRIRHYHYAEEEVMIG